MKSFCVGLLVAGSLVAWSTIPWPGPDASVRAAVVEAPHFGEGGVPQFEKDPAWPKLPAKYRMGFGSAATGDDQGHVWILSRPKTLATPRAMPGDTSSIPAPPVMEFDQAGNFIQGWGGESGPGYQWPTNEHGLTVDSKGFVWVVGNSDSKTNIPTNDNQVLKFTKSGKFVMAIGKSGQTGSNKTPILKGATSLFYYAKTNEMFVSDGYGNSRVIVFDADTGQFKRMWGAYGNKPLDPEDRSKPAPLTPLPWVTVSEVLQQFGSPVHDVKISEDGFVYVADRGNKRVQVFTPDGVFIAEQFVGLDSVFPYQARGIVFSPDQRFLYLGGTPVVYILNRRTLEVLGSFNVGEGNQDHPPGHQIGADTKGNLYVVQAELTGADGKSGGTGAYKWTFKGYSPVTKCCQVTGVHAIK
jgi:hypothetical protein